MPHRPATQIHHPGTRQEPTRFVLDRGMAGDLLDLHVALAPCVLGYAEIGTALEHQATVENRYVP